MKRNIDAFEYCSEICKGIRRGALLTTAHNGRVNTMTIGWGHIGIEWNLPIFVAYVRESRYTKEMIDKTREFTVNITFDDTMTEAIRFCGNNSGRNVDKIGVMGLNLVEGEKISTPGIKEFPLTLECKVLYSQTQESEKLPSKMIERFYPFDDSISRRDNHIAYYAQIVNSYLIEK